MNDNFIKVFKHLSGWTEYTDFEQVEEGHITNERIGDATSFFLWRVDKDPSRLESMYMDGKTYVRFADNAH